MIDLLCDDVLLMICEYLKPSQLLWLMRMRKRLRDVIAPIVKQRYNELVLVVDGDMGSNIIMPLFRRDLKGKILYYVEYSPGRDRKFVRKLGLIIPLDVIGSHCSPKNTYELERVTKNPINDRMVVILYRAMDDVRKVATLYDIDYICYGNPIQFIYVPVDDNIQSVISNLMETMKHNYGNKKRLVYDVKRKRFNYLDFSI